MPIDIDTSGTGNAFTLEEYVHALETSGLDLTKEDDLIASAPLLHRLANNRTFLLERMFEELRSQLTFQSGNLYAPEVLMLHSTPEYFVRANIWKPLSTAELAIPGFQYDVCHDHNFDILTVGYLGPGYSCRSYSYDASGYEGRLGEEVELIDEGIYTLSSGQTALYRAKRDVHIQLPPGEISVSLNLIPRTSAQNQMQFQFEEGSGVICRYLNFSGVEAAIRVADLLGLEESADALGGIATAHPSAKIRALALAAQIGHEPERVDEIRASASGDQSDYVEYLLNMELADSGSTMRSVSTGATR